MKTSNIAYKGIALATVLILLLPLLAMQFTDEVVWNLTDFIVMGGLLFGTGLTYELISKQMGSTGYSVAVGVALLGMFLLVWVNLAVGIIGDEGNPANLMYLGVLAVGIIGAIMVRFQPKEMARVLFATALAQAMTAVIALFAGIHQNPYSSVREILTINGFFVALFLGSAWLFRDAARKETPANPRSNRLP
jgi:hypothetical protein